ncbi:hypothetical protein [Saccharomonospora glauca]|uniref:Uncharacterized protein n=1 Tax=Saccharomonospora glauca K62 TaxID=928724 RepID=I1D1X1_9PSEU|nr:hypothetical protein [Saccharomonospora glauca]EIE98945.1 hypothetical protein SacglDRAFT_02039 [Saccharomonospora glauca K62]
MDRSLDQLAHRLLIQCSPAQVNVAADIAAAHDGGLVITGDSPEPIVSKLRARGFTGPVLCDANRYSGPHRVNARRGLRPAWCRRQHELGLIAVTDSGYLELGDWDSLRSILYTAAWQRGPVIAMLPLAARWLFHREDVDHMARELDAHGVPVAIALEHSGDPFGARYVVRHFLRLLRKVSVPVLVLRSDVSAIGALCHGAHAAAIGTTSTLRHLYPARSYRGGRPTTVSVFVKELLSYHRLDTCEAVFALAPETGHFWLCNCAVCGGNTLARLRTAENPRAVALRHSLHSQFLTYRQVVDRRYAREQLASVWHNTCSTALAAHRRIAEHASSWRVPDHLRRWCSVTDDPLRHYRETLLPNAAPPLPASPTPEPRSRGNAHRSRPDVGLGPGPERNRVPMSPGRRTTPRTSTDAPPSTDCRGTSRSSP